MTKKDSNFTTILHTEPI